MLQDTAPIVPSVSRKDYENSFHDCYAVLFIQELGWELLQRQKAKEQNKVASTCQRKIP